MDRFWKASRGTPEKYSCTHCKRNEIEIRVAVHSGTVSELSAEVHMEKSFVENADETQFMSNVNNEHTLGYCGDVEMR